jgi:hypothetical protein
MKAYLFLLIYLLMAYKYGWMLSYDYEDVDNGEHFWVYDIFPIIDGKVVLSTVAQVELDYSIGETHICYSRVDPKQIDTDPDQWWETPTAQSVGEPPTAQSVGEPPEIESDAELEDINGILKAIPDEWYASFMEIESDGELEDDHSSSW